MSQQQRPRAQSLLDDDDDDAPLAPGGPAPLEPTRPIERRLSALYSCQLGLNPSLGTLQAGADPGDFRLEDSGDERGSSSAGVPKPVPTPPPPPPSRRAVEVESTGATAEDVGEEEQEMYIPGLTSATLFTLLPMTDTLTPLVDKYFAPPDRPLRDLTGQSWRRSEGESLDVLISKQSWRSVADYCREAIFNASPTQTSFILAHWTLRFHALLRLHLIQLVSSELQSLFSLLPLTLFHPVVPFELHILRSSLPGLRGDKETTVELLSEVLRESKHEMWRAKRAGDAVGEDRWRRRVERTGVILAGVLVELKAFSSAAHLLSPPTSSLTSPALRSALCKLHLSTGDLASLSSILSHFQSLPLPTPSISREVRRTKALERVAKGEWAEAETEWRALVAEDPSDLQAINNLAVVILFCEKLGEAITLLTSLLLPPSMAAEEPVLFNLATLKELRTDAAGAEKVALLRRVVEGRGGEGVRAGCLKLAA